MDNVEYTWSVHMYRYIFHIVCVQLGMKNWVTYILADSCSFITLRKFKLSVHYLLICTSDILLIYLCSALFARLEASKKWCKIELYQYILLNISNIAQKIVIWMQIFWIAHNSQIALSNIEKREMCSIWIWIEWHDHSGKWVEGNDRLNKSSVQSILLLKELHSSV